MKFRIEHQIVIDNNLYGALGDDFSIKDQDALKLLMNKIDEVLTGAIPKTDIYGLICYKIHVTKKESLIYCHSELLGIEPSHDIYEMLKQWSDFLERRAGRTEAEGSR